MLINGSDANSLISAQLAAGERQAAQDPARAEQRNQRLAQEDVSLRRAAEAPQTTQGVTAPETEDRGRTGALRARAPQDELTGRSASDRARPDLPDDAQANARDAVARAQARGGDSAVPRRGAAVDVFA